MKSILDRPCPGSVFYVSNASVPLVPNGVGGSDVTGKGTPERPFASIDHAIGKCTANRGDTILVGPGHVETVGSAVDDLDFDVDGIRVVGLGQGDDMARVDFTGDTAGSCAVSGDNIVIESLNFHANVPSVSIGLKVVANQCTGLTVRNCLFDVETSGTDEFSLSIEVGLNCDDITIEDCTFDQGLGAATHAVRINNEISNFNFRRNTVIGDYSTACIASQTAATVDAYIENNTFINGYSGNLNAQPVLEMLTGSTGVVRRNYFFCNVATVAAATVADTMAFSENWYNEDAGAASGGIIRTDATSVTASADD